MIVNIAIVILAFIGMEGVAWFAHKYVMHGFLWIWHKDHHQKETDCFLERNDLFFLVFALPGITGIFAGMRHHFNFLFWVGIGITLYGIAYFFIHDIFIHQRLRWLRRTENSYFKALRRAHKMHHKHLNKEQGECFGMLWVPLNYFRQKSSYKKV